MNCKYIYWAVRAFDVNEDMRNTFSPQFTTEKDAELWKMRYIIDHPDDRIMFDLMQDNGQSYTNGIGCVISDMWVGHALKN